LGACHDFRGLLAASDKSYRLRFHRQARKVKAETLARRTRPMKTRFDDSAAGAVPVVAVFLFKGLYPG